MYVIRTGILALLMLLAVTNSGCRKSNVDDGTEKPTPPVAETESSSTKGHSEEAVIAFVSKLEQGVMNADADALAQIFDGHALLETALDGLGLSATIKKDFNAQEFGAVFMGQLSEQVALGGSYKLQKMVKVEQGYLPRLRLITEAGLNYHELILEADDSGELRIVDIFVFASGETLSATLRRSYLPLAAQINRSLLQRLAGSENTYLKHIKEISQMVNLGRSGQVDEAVKMYDALPAEVQKDQNLMLMRIMWFGLDEAFEEAYVQAIKDYQTTFPDNANINLLMIDYYFLSEQWDKAMDVVNALDQSLNTDPYLDLYRGNIYFSRDMNEKAKEHIEKVVVFDQKLQDPYWSLIQISLEEEDYDNTLRWLKAVSTDAELVLGDITEIQEYEGFVKSPQYQQWKVFAQAQP